MTRELLIFYLNVLSIKSEDKLLALHTGTKILSTNYLIRFINFMTQHMITIV